MLEPVGLVLAAVGIVALKEMPPRWRKVVVGASGAMALAGVGSVVASLAAA